MPSVGSLRGLWTCEQLEVAAKAMLDHGYAPASVNRDLSALGSVYRWRAPDGWHRAPSRGPTLGVSRLEEPIRRVHLEARDLERLRARALAFGDRRFAPFVWLLLDTGARKSELLERRWSEVDLEARRILAPVTRNGTPRMLFFSDRTAQLLGKACPDVTRTLFSSKGVFRATLQESGSDFSRR